MRVKYSPEPCARPEMTELLKSALVRPVVVALAREVRVLTLMESRRRRWLKRVSGVALKEKERVSRWCKSREMAFWSSMEVRDWESGEYLVG